MYGTPIIIWRKNMIIFINNKSGEPIYEQICRQIKAQIIGGVLAEDAPLPSIRSLAKELRISVITTKRAYEELEKEGFIYTAPGRGTFVAGRNSELIKEELLRRIEEHLDAALKIGASCGCGAAELAQMLKALEGDDKE